MKKYKLLFLACLILFSSCDDFLEREPLDFVSPDNYLENENQAEKLLNGVYECLMNHTANARLFPIHIATMTDDAFDLSLGMIRLNGLVVKAMQTVLCRN